MIIFATNNQNKLSEIQAALGQRLTVTGLMQAGIHIEIPEPHDTLEANASEKSRTIHRHTGKNCFSEDTGLEVAALHGEPGVKSARYAGHDRDFEKNVDKLLHELRGIADRRARFRTVISLIWKNEEFLFEGICEGVITDGRRGNHGFGYDPVFQPLGSGLTFAEMTMAEKNALSHRRKAADKLVLFLQNRLTSLTT